MVQKLIAKKLKLSQAQVSRILSGKSGLSMDTCERISSITGYPWHVYFPRPKDPKKLRAELEAALKEAA